MIEPALRLPVARGSAGTKRWHRTSGMLSIVGERERARCNNQMLVCNDRFIWALYTCTWIGTTLPAPQANQPLLNDYVPCVQGSRSV